MQAVYLSASDGARAETTSRPGQPPPPNAEDREGEFLALASHELRAPLAVILASAEVLLAADMTPEVADRLRVIGAEASRMVRLVESLLDVSRAGNGQGVLETTALDVGAACREAADRAATLHGGRRWRVRVAPDTPPVLAHPDRLQLVLGNLLENASKFSPPAASWTSPPPPPTTGNPGTTGEAAVRTPMSRCRRFAALRQGLGASSPRHERSSRPGRSPRSPRRRRRAAARSRAARESGSAFQQAAHRGQ